MRKIALALLYSITILFLVNVAIAAITETETTAASVTVNTFVSTTISTCGDTAFGSLDPALTDNPVTCQSTVDLTAPAVTMTIDAVTNVNVDIALSGTDFTGAGTTIPVTNVDYDDDCNVGGLCPSEGSEGLAKATLSTTLTKYFLDKAASSANKIWFFLDVPSSQKAGAYASTFSFKTVEQGQAL